MMACGGCLLCLGIFWQVLGDGGRLAPRLVVNNASNELDVVALPR